MSLSQFTLTFLSLVFIVGCADKYESSTNDFHYATAITENKLYNADFAIWQRGTTTDLKDGEGRYLADRWYSRNAIGPGSQIRYSRFEEFFEGSRYGAKIQIVEPPHASPQGSPELIQTLANYDSLRFANNRASFSIKLKALGRVSKIGIQFVTNIAEKITVDPMGPEVLVEVRSDRYSTGLLQNVTIGDVFLPAGALGVRVRVAEVTSGNLYDLDNGFIARQAMMNYGAAAGPFRTRFEEFGQEFTACQTFFEKSYSLEDEPGKATQDGEISDVIGLFLQGFKQFTLHGGPVRYRKAKRISKPTVVIYDPRKGGAGGWHHRNTTEPVTALDLSDSAFTLVTSGNKDEEVFFHWTSDAEIYP